jgi:hypothetical protein
MCKNNTIVGGITLYVEDKGGHHSVFGHISVQKEKYYIIRIKNWLFWNHYSTCLSSIFSISFHYILSYFPYLFTIFFWIFHIISLFNWLVFHIFHNFSLFNLFFFHTFQILSHFFHIFAIISPFNIPFFYIFPIFSLFILLFFHIFHLFFEMDCYTYIHRVLLALGRKIDIFKLIYRYLLAFGR